MTIHKQQVIAELGFDPMEHTFPTTENGAADSAFEADILEPIAIVGLSFKFPEDALSEESFWKMLIEKQCVSKEFPKDQFNIDGYYDPDIDKPNKISTRNAHFLKEDVRAFDASFFNMSPQEAESLDPQQRGLLEMTYRALENAGIPLEKSKGSQTSVHVGCFTNDFCTMAWRDPQQIPKYNLGADNSSLSNRLSWFFDFRGVSLTTNTACSSGMVALDLSCNDLWAGRNDMGVVACSNLIFSPEMNISLSNMGFLSPSGKCYSFDHRSNGYGRGEGFGVLILKRVSKAIQDGDTIRALIRSTGTNQDGHTTGGITQPSKDAQARLIKDTYSKAGLDMRVTRFFEAHGTGTVIGDPIEAAAIGESFRCYRDGENPLYVGAVKANIGHLEGASAMAGIIKTIQVLEKGIIPPNTNMKSLNPSIDAEFLNIAFPTEETPWPSTGVRRASVNSFGIGGTNSHVVLDDAYHYLKTRNIKANHRTIPAPPSINHVKLSNGCHKQEKRAPKATGDVSESLMGMKLMVWSAANESSIHRLIANYATFFRELKDDSITPAFLENLAYTLNTRRSSLPCKVYAIASSSAILQDLERIVSKPILASSYKPNLGFVFTGQGAQWFKMGRELFQIPVFRDSLLRSQDTLHALGYEISKDEEKSRVNEPEFSQPLTSAVQIALTDLFRSIGVIPSTVVGHSSGEAAAAFCAGAISASTAMKISYYRGTLASKLIANSASRHTMAAIGLSTENFYSQFESLTASRGFDSSRITVSCINSPNNITVSGPETAISTLVSFLEGRNFFARKLKVGVGYHSPQMYEVASEYLTLLGALDAVGGPPTKTVMVSSVTGKRISTTELQDSQYWVENMTSPVNFLAAIKTCCSDSKDATKHLDRRHTKNIVVNEWFEIGPHAALGGPIREILMSMNWVANYTSVLIRNKSALETFLLSAGHLHCLGILADINQVNLLNGQMAKVPAVLTDLPPYPFDHTVMHWKESRLQKEMRLQPYPKHNLLGTRVADWNPNEPTWRLIMQMPDMNWAEDHKVNGVVVYPAAGMLAMAFEAIRQLTDGDDVDGFEIKDVAFHTPLVLSRKEITETQICLRPSTNRTNDTGAWYEFRLHLNKNAENEWNELCRGSIRTTSSRVGSDIDQGKEEVELLKTVQNSTFGVIDGNSESMMPENMYRHLESLGLHYGPTFQTLDEIKFNKVGEATARVAKHTALATDARISSSSSAYVIHPTTLDGVFQLIFVALSQGNLSNLQTMVPTRIDNMWISSSGAGCPSIASNYLRAYTKAWKHSKRTARSSISLLSEGCHQLLMKIGGFEATAVTTSGDPAEENKNTQNLCFHIKQEVDIDLLENIEIQRYCEKDYPVEVEPIDWCLDMNFISLAFGTLALAGLGDEAAAVPHLRKYTAWMKGQLENFHSERRNTCGIYRHDQLTDSDILKVLSERLSASSRGKLYVKTGKYLTRILQGEVDPLTIIFDDPQLIESFYAEDNASSKAYTLLNPYLDALTHKNPGMRILEIGSGTGATTQILHEMLVDSTGLPKYAAYDFTDISPAFLKKAKENFGTHKRMAFRLLNIEELPSLQGFEDESYDVIVAANVLHATMDLNATIQHTRKLLKPGGKLILAEMTNYKSPRLGFVFGLLPGWWLSGEEYRTSGPCISEDNWHEVLTAGGFSGVDVLFKDFQNPECHMWSIMISTALPHHRDPIVTRSLAPIAIIDKNSESQKAAVEAMNRELEKTGDAISGVFSLEEAFSLFQTYQSIHCIILIELERPLLRNINAIELEYLQTLLSSSKSVLWVQSGGGRSPVSPDYNIVVGLARVFRQENFNIPFVTLALDMVETAYEIPSKRLARHASHIAKVAATMLNNKPTTTTSHESEYVEVDSILQINRVSNATGINEYVTNQVTEQRRIQEFGIGPALKLHVRTPGLIDSLEFIEDTTYEDPLDSELVEVEMHAVGVNFKDMLTVLGRVDTDKLGLEGSGVVKRVGKNCHFLKLGDRVAIRDENSYRSYARPQLHCVVKIPDDMSFVEAAALPLTFSTTWYSLCDVAHLRKGESILIHSASGSTGQSAIQIAKLVGAEIFATVGTTEKKALIMDLYGIPEDHIFFSRDASFADGIKRMTRNRGVDVVLNSLSGDGLVASWESIAPFGRFLEIGKRDIDARGTLGMYPFTKNASFHGIDLTHLGAERPLISQALLQRVISLAAAKKIHEPRPLQVAPISEIQTALRNFQSGKNSGKMVLEIRRNSEVPTSLKIGPSFEFSACATYVIAGGLGGLGRRIARWLVARGARSLLLLSRSGADANENAEMLLDELRSRGVVVEAPICDIADVTSLQSVIDEYGPKMAPIRGCFQASMALNDANFVKMTFQEWEESLKPKVAGSWNLHTILPRGMDCFVMLASACGIFGNAGQSNYAAGNTYQDGLARYRVDHGEKAVSIDLGVVLSDGFVAENTKVMEQFQRLGIVNPIPTDQLLAILDFYCDPTRSLALDETQVVVGLTLPDKILAQGRSIPSALLQPIFSPMHQIDSVLWSREQTREQQFDYKTFFAAAASIEEAGLLVAEALKKKLSNILGIPLEGIELGDKVEAYGVDSLVAVELRNWLSKEMSADVAVFEILGGATFSAVGLTVAAKSSFSQDSWAV